MPKRYFITFGGPTTNYHRAVDRICREAYHSRMFDIIIGITDSNLKQDIPFWETHGTFLESNKRGYGYWLWKPYLIMETFKKIPENDIVVYVDTGIKIRNNISDLLNNLAQKDIVLFGSMFKIRSYTKRDLLRFLNMDNAETLNSQQIQGGIIIVRNTKYSRQFINKWLELSQNEQLITDIPSENEYPDFINHRHDQSIISLLALQNQQNIIFVPFEEKHRYFYHHRRRNTNFIPLVIDGTLLIEKNIDPKKPLSFWDNMIYQTLLMIN